MDIEQLRLIIEAFNGVQESATTGVVVWFSLLAGEILIDAGLIATFLYMVYKLAWRLMTVVSEHVSDNDQLKTMRDTMGIGTPGHVTTGEYEAMIRWIKQRFNS